MVSMTSSHSFELNESQTHTFRCQFIPSCKDSNCLKGPSVPFFSLYQPPGISYSPNYNLRRVTTTAMVMRSMASTKTMTEMAMAVRRSGPKTLRPKMQNPERTRLAMRVERVKRRRSLMRAKTAGSRQVQTRVKSRRVTLVMKMVRRLKIREGSRKLQPPPVTMAPMTLHTKRTTGVTLKGCDSRGQPQEALGRVNRGILGSIYLMPRVVTKKGSRATMAISKAKLRPQTKIQKMKI